MIKLRLNNVKRWRRGVTLALSVLMSACAFDAYSFSSRAAELKSFQMDTSMDLAEDAEAEDAYIESINTSAANYSLRNPRVAFNTRETVAFGNYWQEDTNNDGKADKNDSKQPIIWQVLEKYDDGTALVISDKILDKQIYFNGRDVDGGKKDYSCTWETSDIRNWLNDEFFYDAFSSTERTALRKLNVVNNDNGTTDGGNDTQDNVFLPSLDELKNASYGFNSDYNYKDQARISKATSYARTLGLGVNVDGFSSYWLRSPGERNSDAVIAMAQGDIFDKGYGVTSRNYGVRPAIRIDLKSSYVKKKETINVSIKGVEWDTVNFGKYNGKDISWRVLNVSGNDAFLLSEKNITTRAYNEVSAVTTWKECTLRSWLNKDFYDESFNQTEKEMIKSTNVVNNDNKLCNTSGGSDTVDKVFLLSIDDAIQNSYGFSDLYSVCSDSRNVKVSVGEVDWWWLRSPGEFSNWAVHIQNNKPLFNYANGIGTPVNYVGGIRPCLHIDLSSSGWKMGSPVAYGNPAGGTVIPINQNQRTDIPIENKKEIVKSNQVINGIKNITKTYSTKSFKLKATTNGDGKLTYTSSNKKVATISSKGVVKLVGAGKTKITVKAAGTSRYNSAQKTIILTVKRGKQKITGKIKSKSMVYTKKPFSLGTKVLGKAKVTYKSSDTKVLKVNSKGVVTLTGIGKASIIIKTKKNSRYAAATKKIVINVLPPKVKLKCKALPGKKVALSWNSSPVFDGYYVEIAYDSEFKNTVRNGVGYFDKGKKEAVISGFSSPGTKYYVRIRPYCKANGADKYYAWSNVTSFTVIE